MFSIIKTIANFRISLYNGFHNKANLAIIKKYTQNDITIVGGYNMLEKIRMSKAYACDMFWERIITLAERCCKLEEYEFCERIIYMEDIIEDEGNLKIISEANKYLAQIDKNIFLAKSILAGEPVIKNPYSFARTDLYFKVNLVEEGIEILNIKGPEYALEIIAKRLAKKFESKYAIKDGVLTVWVKV